MAFSVSQRVRVVDQSSAYRKHRGTVKSVVGDLHQVQLEGGACAGRVALRTDQLQTDGTTMVISYAQCSS